MKNAYYVSKDLCKKKKPTYPLRAERNISSTKIRGSVPPRSLSSWWTLFKTLRFSHKAPDVAPLDDAQIHLNSSTKHVSGCKRQKYQRSILPQRERSSASSCRGTSRDLDISTTPNKISRHCPARFSRAGDVFLDALDKKRAQHGSHRSQVLKKKEKRKKKESTAYT